MWKFKNFVQLLKKKKKMFIINCMIKYLTVGDAHT